jgi:muramoyltetrapeptide carboxypeptidase
MVAYLRTHLRVPILTGLPFGHGRDKSTLVNGAQARLLAQKNTFELRMGGYPSLHSPG